MTATDVATSGIADAHLHLFRRGYHGRDPVDGSDVTRYESLRARHGIRAGLVVGYQTEGIDPGNNNYLTTLAADRGWMATVAFLSVRAPTIRHLEGLLTAGHCGIALYLPDLAAAEAVAHWPPALWGFLESGGSIVSVNAPPEACAGLVRLVRSRPGCRFLFSHLGLPGRYLRPPPISAAAQRLQPLLSLSASESAFVKISGLYAISDPPDAYPHVSANPFVDTILDTFGAARCLWGSDFSPSLDHVTFAQTLELPALDRLTDAERRQVMGGTLLALLRPFDGTHQQAE